LAISAEFLGQEVATLVDEEKAVGRYEVRWDAAGIASGVYFYRLQAGEFVETKKLVLLRGLNFIPLRKLPSGYQECHIPLGSMYFTVPSHCTNAFNHK